MPARNVYSISFPDDLDNVILGLMRELRLSRARAVQYLCRKGLESDPVGAGYLKQKLADNERERSALTEHLEALEKMQADCGDEQRGARDPGPYLGPRTPLFPRAASSRKASATAKQDQREEGRDYRDRGQFERLARALANGERLEDRALSKLKVHGQQHPDWLERLEPEDRVPVEKLMSADATAE